METETGTDAEETDAEETDAGETGAGEAAADERAGTEPAPDWWHRDHPTFTALSGFFTGLVYVCVVPAAFAGVMGTVFGTRRMEELFPFVLVMLVVPLLLVLIPRTRRFGGYMWLGIVLTAIVVVGVGALVLWFMVRSQS